MNPIAIVFHSGYGHTRRVAEHVHKGAAAAGAEIWRCLRVAYPWLSRRRKCRFLQQKEAAFGFREKPGGMHRFFHQGHPESWRAALTSAQVSAIEMSHAEVMHRFGYTLSAHRITT